MIPRWREEHGPRVFLLAVLTGLMVFTMRVEHHHNKAVLIRSPPSPARRPLPVVERRWGEAGHRSRTSASVQFCINKSVALSHSFCTAVWWTRRGDQARMCCAAAATTDCWEEIIYKSKYFPSIHQTRHSTPDLLIDLILSAPPILGREINFHNAGLP